MKMGMIIGAVIGVAVLATGYYLSRFRPIVSPIPVEEVDAISQKTGMTDCFWIGVSTQGTLIPYPDTGASYWITQFDLPKGATLELRGEFPHARHLSFNTYDQQGQPVDRLNDSTIEPESGATNPFVTGARRDAPNRNYRVQIAEADVEAGTPIADTDRSRTRNTVFVPSSKKPALLWMRIYVPDEGKGALGGASLPTPILKLADGRIIEGEALCRQIVRKEGAVLMAHLRRDANLALFNLSSSTSPHHPAQPEPKWFPFFNPLYVLAPNVYGTRLEWITSLLSTKRKGGYYSTLDNTYIATMIDRRFGDVLVIKGKAPTTPQTVAGEPVMQSGQLRYWSICKYRSLYDPSVNSCLYDQQIPTDAAGNFTIVVSKPEHRPANATAACGAAWMDWGELGDGIGNPAGGMLVYRHMLPAADFKNSFFEINALGDEAKALGEYYPAARYMSRQEFEKTECPKRN